MNANDWQALWMIAWPLLMVGLLIDRYFLEEKRLVTHMIERTVATGKCVCCSRPIKLIKDGFGADVSEADEFWRKDGDVWRKDGE